MSYIEELIIKKQTEPKKLLPTSPMLRALIDGVCDTNCQLSVFVGTPHILQTIWSYVTEYWSRRIIGGIDLEEDSLLGEIGYGKEFKNIAYHGFYESLKFPEPKGICINMMPFVMERSFKKCKLPNYLKPYWDEIINKAYCFDGETYLRLIAEREIGKIGYLTIHESYVGKNETQRRGGLHTDCPGKVMIIPNNHGDYVCMGRVNEEEKSEIYKLGEGTCTEQSTYGVNRWGGGNYGRVRELIGGIFMASNVEESCEVLNCRIIAGENESELGEEIIGEMGDVEHLIDVLSCYEREAMDANTMYWVTDRTPHRALPLKEGSYRQYFRLVTSQVSIWFEDHSTKNPLGVMPDPAVTKIIKGSKFKKNWSLLLQLNGGENDW